MSARASENNLHQAQVWSQLHTCPSILAAKGVDLEEAVEGCLP
jgi:hypothetical protein